MTSQSGSSCYDLPLMSLSVLWILSLALQVSPGLDPPATREESSASPKREVERVMNTGLPFAERTIAEQREFVPFGAVMRSDGLIQVVGTERTRQKEPIERTYKRLLEALQEGADSGAYKVVATFVLVELPDPQTSEPVNAVHVALENRDGYCVDVYYPIVQRDEELALGEAFAGKRSGVFFSSCN